MKYPPEEIIISNGRIKTSCFGAGFPATILMNLTVGPAPFAVNVAFITDLVSYGGIS